MDQRGVRRIGAWLGVVGMAAVILWYCFGSQASAALYTPHPDDPAKRVEFYVRRPAGNGPWPAIVFLHGHQNWLIRPGGRDYVDRGVLDEFAARGYLAVAISQPGYGGSSGPADFSGPVAQHAVAGVIAKLRADGEAASQVILEGASMGAITAGLVTAHDPSITGVVMISGVYDLAAYYNQPDPDSVRRGIMRAIKSETGATPEALDARSILRQASAIKAPVLILGGAKDDRTDPQQARVLAEAIVRAGGNARAIIYPDFGHQIPVEARNKDIDPFIDGLLRRDGS